MLGDTTDLYREIVQHMSEKTALNLIESQTIEPEGHVLLPQNTSGEGGFQVDASHPYVSLIAQIYPSPDWFIGVQDVDLCNRIGGEWSLDRRETLFPYDAGTKSGSYFYSGNNSTPTSKDISPLDNGDLANESRGRGMGYFLFTLVSKFPRQADGSDTVKDYSCPNAGPFAKWSWYLLPPIMMMNILFFN